MTTFYARENDLNIIVKKLEEDKKLNSMFEIGPERGLPPIEKSYPEVYSILKRTGITDASSHPYFTPRKRWYYLKTNWSNGYPVYIIYNAHDSAELSKGEHKKDEVSNEWWGLGEHWTLFRLVKEKDVKQ